MSRVLPISVAQKSRADGTTQVSRTAGKSSDGNAEEPQASQDRSVSAHRRWKSFPSDPTSQSEKPESSMTAVSNFSSS